MIARYVAMLNMRTVNSEFKKQILITVRALRPREQVSSHVWSARILALCFVVECSPLMYTPNAATNAICSSGVPQYLVKLAPVARVTKKSTYAMWCSARHSLSNKTPLCFLPESPFTMLSIIVPTTAATIAASKTAIHRTVWWCAVTNSKIPYFVFLGNQTAIERTPRTTSATTIVTPANVPDGAEIPAARTPPIPMRGRERQSAPCGRGICLRRRAPLWPVGGRFVRRSGASTTGEGVAIGSLSPLLESPRNINTSHRCMTSKKGARYWTSRFLFFVVRNIEA
jgi:hypothetical protein